MSIQPKKLKAHIGTLKETLDKLSLSLSADGGSRESLSLSLSSYFKLLLLAELCQRGVVLPVDDILNSPEGNTKLLEAIQNAAGKAMLDESKVPKPLVAGSAVISSMVAENFADRVCESSPDAAMMGFLSDEESRDVLRRCEDVSDGRFQILLNLGRTSYVEEYCTGILLPPPSSSKQSPIQCFQVAGILLLQISMGNILRAASFSNPDQPPMWKRSLDMCIKLHVITMRLKKYLDCTQEEGREQNQNEDTNNHDMYEAYHTSGTILPLTNLIRIAETKHNSKRVSELSLRLTESYINSNDDIHTRLLSDKGCALWKDVTTVYVDTYIPQEAKIGTNGLDNIAKGRKVLKKFDISSTDSIHLKVLHQISCLRIEIEHEHLLVQSITEARCAAAKNRTGVVLGDSSKDKVNKTESIRVQVKREVLTKTLPDEDFILIDDYDDVELDNAAVTLQKTVLSIALDDLNQHVPTDMQDAIYDLLKTQVNRLIQRAQAFSVNHHNAQNMKKSKPKQSDVENAWDAVESYVTPLVKLYADTDDKSMISSSKMNLSNAASKVAFIIMWMKRKENVPLDFIESATNCLVDCHDKIRISEQWEKKRDEEDSKQNIIKTSGSTTDNSEKDSVDGGIWTGRCHLYLARLSSQSEEAAKNCELISRKADQFTALSKSSTSHAQYGMPYLMFLACWSGLHQAPWSFCNVVRAREIICLARESLLLCKHEWGRETTDVEEMLLNLGEADAESGFLSGGFIDKAKGLYEDVLSTISKSNINGLDPLIRSHCVSGLMMITLSQTGSDSESLQYLYAKAVEGAKDSLENLMVVKESNIIPTSFQNWRSPDAFQTSLDFHFCQLRTLVAESLIRSSKPMEAELFLKQAVKDSPLNYDAAFALGAFWLRMSFIEDKKYSKKAKSQLLKSLQLDQSEADPFALLGIWYEDKDFKRALGCYSKALTIDPSHPVAGRGILRLTKQEELLRVCNEAISISSNTSGWAWRALGESKALMDGIDEEAILCYQQALRHRDIEHSKQQILGVFFVPPFNGAIGKECGETWSALASCYRRLGKYSASLRAYESALIAGPCNDYICAWAQVELELGLLDDAALKFEQVIRDSSSSHFSASFGLASCMLPSANRNIEEGKYGAALNDLMKGIKSLSIFIEDETKLDFICTLKMLGDLYSHGYRIPSSVFVGFDPENFETKEDYLKKGEYAYMQLLNMVKTKVDMPDNSSLLAATLNDIGTNLLLQACSYSDLPQTGNILNAPKLDKKVLSLLENSKQFFIESIASNELDPLSWCGLGCALCPLDVMLSQHAFCRALQLDKKCPEAWVNLGLMYADLNKLSESEKAIDALTQVADTPLMWVARGLLLEKSANQEACIDKKMNSASDAYRACLQTSRDPSALLGVALTCRRLGLNSVSNSHDYKLTAEKVFAKESHANLTMLLNSSEALSPMVEFLYGIMMIERADEDIKSELIDLVEKVLHSSGIRRVTTDGHINTDKGKQTISMAECDVHQNPGSGECWLKLGKQLFLSLAEVRNPSEHSCNLVVDVVRRAKYILRRAISEPVILYPTNASSNVHKSMVSMAVKATQLSEAHALSSWTQQHDEPICSIDLQHSLLLDPENCFARAKLEG